MAIDIILGGKILLFHLFCLPLPPHATQREDIESVDATRGRYLLGE